MPSRSFYWRTADGYLEKNDQEYPSTTQSRENGFVTGIEECSLWSKERDTSEVLCSEMDGFPAPPFDIISENMLLDDAPFERDDTGSKLLLGGLHSSNLESIVRDSNRNLVRSLPLGHALSLSEIRELRDIAMPPHTLSNAARVGEVESGCSSENDMEVRGKKRKSSTGSEEAEAVSFRQTKKQQGHNAIEKRYRSSLNDKIYALRQRVPSLRTITEGVQANADTEEGGESVPNAGQKYGKAEILTGAVAYISHLEDTVERLGGDVTLLQARIMAFERLAMSGSIVMSNGLSSTACGTKTLQTVQADFDRTNPGDMKEPTKQLRTSRRLQ